MGISSVQSVERFKIISINQKNQNFKVIGYILFYITTSVYESAQTQNSKSL